MSFDILDCQGRHDRKTKTKFLCWHTAIKQKGMDSKGEPVLNCMPLLCIYKWMCPFKLQLQISLSHVTHKMY